MHIYVYVNNASSSTLPYNRPCSIVRYMLILKYCFRVRSLFPRQQLSVLSSLSHLHYYTSHTPQAVLNSRRPSSRDITKQILVYIIYIYKCVCVIYCRCRREYFFKASIEHEETFILCLVAHVMLQKIWDKENNIYTKMH